MGERREFEMTDQQLNTLLEVSKPTPAIMVGGVLPDSPQERANRFWKALGEEMGFDGMTVRRLSGKSGLFFTAEVVSERPTREQAEHWMRDPAIVGSGEESEVSYHGYIEIDVRLMRQGHGPDGEEYAQEQRRSVRIEEVEAKWIGRACPDDLQSVQETERGALRMAEVEAAIKDVLDEDMKISLSRRFERAASMASPEKIQAALEVLES